jgi:DNA ligase (NAD+)
MSTSTYSQADKIKFLAEQIIRHRDSYHDENKKVRKISDAAYDAQEDALKELDPENPAVTSVGAEPQSEWKKAKHALPMGSLDKVKTPEALLKWIGPKFHTHTRLFVTEKLDGASIEVIYNKGRLVQAITRGNGTIGDDITANVLRMSGVHATLPIEFTGSLRGEIILTKSNFGKFFAGEDYANTRNAASGVSKRLDGINCEKLKVLFYQIVGDIGFQTEADQFNYLQSLNLEVPNFTVAQGTTLEEQLQFVVEWWNLYQNTYRDKLDWELDGLVVRINALEDQTALGDTHFRPHGAIAFKFRADSAETIALAIQLQVGNSGRITPVLEIETVHLVGADVNRASLYNFAYIQEMGLDVGAKVVIVRANDVIPRCEAVLEPTGTIFQPPTQCPVCQGPVIMNGENLHCMNTDTCPAQIVGRLKNWINTLNVLEWGDKLLERLAIGGHATSIVDLYKLSIDDLAKLERMGKVSATKCHSILWQHNPISLDNFIGGLSIPMIGSSTIRMVIAGGIDTLDKMLDASREAFSVIKGLGPVKSQCLFEGLRRNAAIINGLLEAGIEIQACDEADDEPTDGKLNDMIICITGSTNIKRNDLIKLISTNGGKFKDSVSKGCTHLIIADPNKQSKKTDNANKLGIKMISENEFLSLLE